ncbi:hypothetical protein PAP_05420 [Palaeococcus pacificus DY20341]|uniref:Uncharacterized protein n=1 Tax=Palaeococcus pacificus DY20341 TaxID=1343739 RepID=A0A075LU48_9EURY|nr:choice-of-anchor L domain-containing protein [Palaeococcus pacificus]AIF69487.1 hypothetical protein PAP_05420 [Palaeococcus pacificus DY20341]
MNKKLLSLWIVGLFLISLGVIPAFLGSFAVGQGGVVTRDATQEALAILSEDSKNTLVKAEFKGVDSQILIATANKQGFPIDGNSYLILSTGNAEDVLSGDSSVGISSGLNGVSIPDGHPVFSSTINDVATLKITLRVPRDAKTLTFKWKFGSDEIPSYVGSYRDYFRAYVVLPNGSTKDLALLPNGDIPYVGGDILNYTNIPDPDDVALNEVTAIFTGTLDVTEYRNQEITIVFQVADEWDSVVDTAAFIDDLRFERVSPAVTYLSLLTLTQLWTKYFFNYYDEFNGLYANATELGVDNETLQKALELHNSAIEHIQHAWRTEDLEEIRARIWIRIQLLPRISDTRKAYLKEKEAVELLREAIEKMT